MADLKLSSKIIVNCRNNSRYFEVCSETCKQVFERFYMAKRWHYVPINSSEHEKNDSSSIWGQILSGHFVKSIDCLGCDCFILKLL